MKITKNKLRKLIREELESSSGEEQQGRTSAAVSRVGDKIDNVAGLDALLGKIKSRLQLEELLMKLIKVSSENVKPKEVVLAVANVYKKLRKQ